MAAAQATTITKGTTAKAQQQGQELEQTVKANQPKHAADPKATEQKAEQVQAQMTAAEKAKALQEEARKQREIAKQAREAAKQERERARAEARAAKPRDERTPLEREVQRQEATSFRNGIPELANRVLARVRLGQAEDAALGAVLALYRQQLEQELAARAAQAQDVQPMKDGAK